MKLRYFFLTVAACAAALFTSCGPEEVVINKLEGLTISTSYLSIAEGKDEATLDMTINDSWSVEMDEETAKWLAVTPASGAAGTHTLTFTAANAFGHEGQVDLKFGDKVQNIKVVRVGAEQLEEGVIFQETFEKGQGAFEAKNTVGNNIWNFDSQYGMVGTGYLNNANTDSDSRLISPEIDLTGVTAACLTFEHAVNYAKGKAAELLSVEASADGGTNWTKLAFADWPSDSWTFVPSGDIALSDYVGKKIKIAFHYTSTTAVSPTWEVRNVKVEEKAAVIVPKLGISKTAVTVTSDAQKVELTLTGSNLSAAWNIAPAETYDWVTDYTKTGAPSEVVSATIEVSLAENTGEERTATFNITSEGAETVSFTITQTKAFVASDVAGIVKQLVSTSSSAKSPYKANLTTPATITFVCGNNVFIEDASGAVLYFKSGHGLTAGKTVGGEFTGEGYLYNNLPEITSIGSATIAEGTAPAPTEVTIAQLLANYDSYLNRYVIIKGVTVTDGVATGDRDGKIKVGEDEMPLRVQVSSNIPTIATGAKGDIICFPAIYKTTKQLGVYVQEHFISSDPSITCADATISAPATAGTASFSITVKNLTAKWTVTPADTYDWATVKTSEGTDSGNIDIDYTANTGASRTAKFTVASEGATSVELTLTQTASASASDVVYTKLTAAPADWTAGKYLIVQESTNDTAINGAGTATTIKSGKDSVSVAIVADKISVPAASDNFYFTIENAAAADKYFVKSASGMYISATSAGASASNTMNANENSAGKENTLAITDGVAIITSVANGEVLRFNVAHATRLFRYYKSDSYTKQDPVYLYMAE